MYATAQFRSARLLAILFVLLVITASMTVAAAQSSPTTITPAENVPAVNVRSGPGTEYTVRFALNAGQTLVATGRTEAAACIGNAEVDGWVRITVSETIEGWVSLCAVEVSGDVDALPVAEPAFPELIAEAEPLAVLEGGSSFTKPDLVAETNSAVVMRSEPWLGSEALGIVPANAAVELMQMTTNMGWVQAQFGDAAGWLPGMSVSATDEQMDVMTVVSIDTASQTLGQFANSGSGAGGFCYWLGGLVLRLNPYTLGIDLVYEPNYLFYCV
jgi:uncharacterized protein YraI